MVPVRTPVCVCYIKRNNFERTAFGYVTAAGGIDEVSKLNLSFNQPQSHWLSHQHCDSADASRALINSQTLLSISVQMEKTKTNINTSDRTWC